MNTILKLLRFLGPTVLFFSTFVALPALAFGALNNNLDQILLNICIGSLFYSFLIMLTLRRRKFSYTPRDGFLITFVCWVFISLLASLPFYYQGLSFSDSFFEAVSGLTTTGSTILQNVESYPDYLLLYRQLLQWAGGVGLVIVVLAIIPAVSGGVKVLQAETSGFADKSFSPRLRETARSLLGFYLLLTLVCIFSYWAAGMTFFEATTHSFSTVSIGGFSIYTDNFGHFDSQTIEGIATIFMLLSAMNFGLHFLSLSKGSIRYYLQNDEFKFFLVVVLFAVLVSVLTLNFKEGMSFADSLRYGIFQTISIVTTTGFTLEPLNNLGTIVPLFIFIIAFMGACSGSVGGGMKAWRVLMFLRVSFTNITKLMHPSAVAHAKMNNEKIQSSQIEAVFSFIAIYILFFLIFMFILMFQNLDFFSSFSGTAAAINNLGPGLGELSENYSSLSNFSKITLAAAMIVGRLELFGVLVLMLPAYWRS